MSHAHHDPLNEQLSAFLDGELPPEETDLLLKRLARDPELRARLGRYGLVGDTLRGERTRASAAFALRVSGALASEPALEPVAVLAPAAVAVPVARPARAAQPRWFKPVAGFAVAATVAGLAVLVLQRDPVPTGGAPVAQVAPTNPPAAASGATPAPQFAPVAPVATALPSNGEPASYVTPPAGRAGIAPIPPAQLANYVVAHSGYSSPLGRRNVLTGLLVDEPPEIPPAAPPAPVAPQTAPGRAPVAAGTP